MARKSGKNDESRERSRAALLQAGADLMIEDALNKPFAALRLRRLCERAGLSTGAFYVHWDRLEDYHADLVGYLTEADELGFADDFAAMTQAAAIRPGESALTALSRLADADISLLVANPIWDAMELVNLTWGRTNFRYQLASGYQTVDRQTGELYGSILTEAGREPRPPLTWETIGTILQALAEGLGLRHKIDPAAVPATSQSIPGLYPIAITAVLAVLTRPLADQASADEAIQALMDTDARNPGIAGNT